MRRALTTLAGLTTVAALTLGSALAATASPVTEQPVSAQPASEATNDCVADVSILQSGKQRYYVRVSATCSSLAPGTEFRGVLDPRSGLATPWSAQPGTVVSQTMILDSTRYPIYEPYVEFRAVD